MTIGLKRGTVQLLSYDPEWVIEFKKEKALLESAFGSKVAGIEHIGSTSVPGLVAKPIIDIIMAVDSFNELADFITRLQKIGYEYMPDRMFADRKFFPKGPRSNRTHHLSLVLKNDPEQWVKPIAFRDYLRDHDADVREYARIKNELAQEYRESRDEYTKLKASFITAILNKI